MGETTQATDNSPTLEVVPTIGVGLSGVALAGVFVPLRRGVSDPVITVAVVCALFALVAFVARRHGLLDRTVGGLGAAAASLCVVLLSGYALNQEIAGSVSLSLGVGSVSLSTVFGAFLAASIAIGVGIAESVGIDGYGVLRRARTTVGLTILGWVGLFSAALTMELFAVPVVLLRGEISDVEWMVVAQVGMAVGTGLVAIGYLVATDRDWSFIDLRVPTLRDVGWTVGGVALLFGALLVISVILSTTGTESAEHATVDQARENPELMLVLIPAAILVIGPFEELLYRNVVQKAMYDVFSRQGAIVAGSVVFSIVHLSAYATAGLGAVMASLGVVFGLSLVLGFIYERTDNLVVPALVHGIYNAVVFANLYFTYA
ncbi:CPBP family intramembrane metalloprotease [Halobacteria archaeon AArc-m2/3/4]|uniref:CPBP family intramembrane metalloprotease n=1 Tax=Natronoglomus mannanivorans TaxID=2979990 RepID=A0AAP3E0R0_9EURY|nr:CPBP family intramembrane metalloprotease [Halobacteria archaeon AArc-xg1-1]MCU4972707.1 CPBP family intramembrane metalloprotease [Halobacteria archaeon AArc-m2/3/4]